MKSSEKVVLEHKTEELQAARSAYAAGQKQALRAAEEIYGDLLETYAPRLRRVAIHAAMRTAGGGDPLADGDDILQIAALRGLILLQRSSFEISGGKDWFVRWLARVIYFVAAEDARKRYALRRGGVFLRMEPENLAAEGKEAYGMAMPDSQVLAEETLGYLRQRAKSQAQQRYLAVLEELASGYSEDALSAATKLAEELGSNNPRSLAAASVRWARKELLKNR